MRLHRPGPAVRVLLLSLGIGPALASGVHAWPSLGGGTGLLDVRTVEVPTDRSIDAQFGFLTYSIPGGTVPNDPRTRRIADGGLHVTTGFGDYAEVWGVLPALVHDVSDSNAVYVHRDGFLGAKLVSPRSFRGMTGGLILETNVPYGNRARGASNDSWDPAITGLLTLRLPDSNTFTAANLHFNVGYHAFGDVRGRTFEGAPLYYQEPVYPKGDNDRLDLRGALEVRSERTTLFIELLLDQLLSEDLSFSESPLFLSSGFRAPLTESFSFLLAAKISLASDDLETTRFRSADDIYPDWQLGFAVAWSRRGAGADRDGDGVPDRLDQCPYEAEDLDGWEDSDGCPDLDNDNDGVPDAFDGAPNLPEDRDGFLDTDGIPDPDNDGDGVPDSLDHCPLAPEDMDGIADGDGCPETDADGDGILDEDDLCPLEAETVNGVEDDDGCPDETGQVGATPMIQVMWEGRAVAPQSGGFAEINRLAEDLLSGEHSSVEIRVRTLVDRADQRAFELARQRAAYLKAFLVSAGVEEERVRTVSEAGPDPLTGYTGTFDGDGRARFVLDSSGTR